MELREFATRILFEPSLTAKLETRPQLVAGSPLFVDDRRGAAIQTPDAPGRPEGLELKPRGATPRVPFPTAKALEDPQARGIVLHFFANHELLAMELMAIALLKFPDAPPGFRQGLARTIIEEQKHLGLYLHRMRELGVEFGAAPVNRFFWDCIAAMTSPLEYVTKMSLTLEQANLDFSRHYRDLFAGLGDQATAALLDVVYQEEIGHVKHGVVWFNRWRPGEHDDWDEYQRLLPPPLSPIRAKGIGFDRDARRLAGLSERFIDELAIFKHSKGRPPVVYWFNPACEIEVAQAGAAAPASKVLTAITADLATLMQFVTRGDDVVWVPRRPTSTFLAGLQDLGIPIPQFIESAAELSGRPVATIEPWGQSPAAARRGATLGVECLQPKTFVPDEVAKRVFSKAFGVECLSELEPSWCTGQVLANLEGVERYIQDHFAKSSRLLVLKAPYGSSGRNMLRVKAPGLESNQRQWVAKTLEAQGALIAEPWLDRVVDLSVQVNVANGRRPLLGVTRFLTDRRGQYVGHRLGHKFADLPPTTRRALHEGGFLERLDTVAAAVASKLEDAGYVGPAGIDALIYQEGERLELKPVVEINPRYTMGRLALELDRYVHHTVDALWLHLSLKQVQALGYADFPAFVRDGRERYPPRRRHGSAGLLTEGFVATNDPATATMIQTVLLLGSAADFVRGAPAEKVGE